MQLSRTALGWIVASTALWPLLASLGLGALWLVFGAPRERTTARVVNFALNLSLLSTLATAVFGQMRASGPASIVMGHWFRAGEYGFEVVFLVDHLSLAMMVLTAVITALIGRFSVNYLHREPGFFRFFVLLALFAGGMHLLVSAGTYDLLFAGWELVGLSSALLIAFFHERAQPVRAGLRAFITYRLCDVGLLVGAVLVHQTAHSAAFADAFGHSDWPGPAAAHIGAGAATTIALFLLLASMGKSALFPVGNWLPRAMEGPTPSSAIFYCALSVHAGAYLLLRSAPILQRAPLASLAILVIGALTALHATVAWRVQADAKGALAYATMTQVGLIYCEIGLGFYRFATLHLIGHACLRGFQMLRAPSALRDALAIRAANAGAPLPSFGLAHRLLPDVILHRIYRAALERFYLDTLQERWLAQPLLRLGSTIDRFERRWVRSVGSWIAHDSERATSRPVTPALATGEHRAVHSTAKGPRR